MWTWFKAYGDKLLLSLTTLALSPALSTVLPKWVSPTLALLSTLQVTAGGAAKLDAYKTLMSK